LACADIIKKYKTKSQCVVKKIEGDIKPPTILSTKRCAPFKRMKTITLITILILTIVSCTQSRIDKLTLCINEIKLLKSDSSFNVDFDFSLNMENQFENLQSQIDDNICNKVYPLNSRFHLTETNTVETLIITEKYCNDDTAYIDQPCILIRTLRIFLNRNSQILFENNILEIDSLKQRIAEVSKDFFINNNYKYAAYQIYWDERTPIEFRKAVYAEVIRGYLIAANDLSISMFKKDICELKDNEIEKIQKRFRIVFSLKDNLPPLPPSPKILQGIEPDTVEHEINEFEIKEK